MQFGYWSEHCGCYGHLNVRLCGVNICICCYCGQYMQTLLLWSKDIMQHDGGNTLRIAPDDDF